MICTLYAEYFLQLYQITRVFTKSLITISNFRNTEALSKMREIIEILRAVVCIDYEDTREETQTHSVCLLPKCSEKNCNVSFSYIIIKDTK